VVSIESDGDKEQEGRNTERYPPPLSSNPSKTETSRTFILAQQKVMAEQVQEEQKTNRKKRPS